jgi:signal transduction histidine kinase/phage shock protein PspC (stress-responsive transcriptional regulator)
MSQTAPARVLVRSSQERWLGGVCGGLADHWGVPVVLVRIGFVVAGAAGGIGVLAYLLLWVLVPSEDVVRPGSRPARGLDLTGTLGLVSMAIGVLIGLSLLGLPIRVSLWVPVLLAGAGIVVLWRQGDDARARAERAALPQAEPSGIDRAMVVRILVGLVLLLLGIVGILVPRLSLMTLLQAMVATAALLAGCILIALPWIRALAERLQAERIATARAEERAAMASRVHDSVLQTLTLIQRRAGDAEEVSRLARAEERALRSWLYAPVGPRGMLAATLAGMVAATEADYDVRVELVTVGDVLVDDRVAGLVAATREAVVNAAKHAHGSATMVYVEVADGQVEVNVRDRGAGFDPETIGEDRHGVRESIVGRMTGLGGRASVRSNPGEGTEVRLIMPVGGFHE